MGEDEKAPEEAKPEDAAKDETEPGEKALDGMEKVDEPEGEKPVG